MFKASSNPSWEFQKHWIYLRGKKLEAYQSLPVRGTRLPELQKLKLAAPDSCPHSIS